MQFKHRSIFLLGALLTFCLAWAGCSDDSSNPASSNDYLGPGAGITIGIGDADIGEIDYPEIPTVTYGEEEEESASDDVTPPDKDDEGDDYNPNNPKIEKPKT